MCNLCSNNQKERDSARRHCEYISDKLLELSRYYMDLSNSLIEPHDINEIKKITPVALNIVRILVEEWV